MIRKIRKKYDLAGSINLISNLNNKKPVVFHGEYLKGAQLLLSKQYQTLLEPRILWIDYKVIPIMNIIKLLTINPLLVNQLFFLPIINYNLVEEILKSDELFLLNDHRFSTLIIDIPSDFTFSNDIEFRFKELSKNIQIIFFMTKLLLPSSLIKEIKVETEYDTT